MESKKEKVENILKVLKKLFPQTKPTLVYHDPWQLLVAVILSARNTDKKVNEVTGKLFKKYKNIKDYKTANLKDLEKDLSQLGLYRQKAKFIKETAKIIDEKYNGIIPNSMEKLIELPGVGRKTANVFLTE